MKAVAWTFGFVSLLICVVAGIQALPSLKVAEYDANTAAVVATTTTTPPVVKHIKTPSQVKAIYMTSNVAASVSIRSNLVKLMEDTEANAVVIDIKDYTGNISYEMSPGIEDFIKELHEKGIYVIGRISCFQDSNMVKTHPELAVRRESDNGVWADHKGIHWIDASAPPMWDYLVNLGHRSYALGFDELNFDYIRFPSDGNMKDIKYPFSGTKKKSLVLRDFFEHLRSNFKNIPISADLFGMTTTNNDDLGIGQVLEYALENFDYVSPMVYPSHYPANFGGFKNPNTKPYEVIHIAMSGGVQKINKMNSATTTASSSPISIKKLRPWLQDFSIFGVTYTADMVRAQIRATYDVGLDSFMLWNASNRYTKGGLLSPDHTFATSTTQ